MNQLDNFDFDELLESLKDIESDFLSNEPKLLSSLVNRLESLQRKAVIDVQSCSLSHKSISRVRQITRRLQIVAQTRLSLEETYEDLASKICQQASHAFGAFEDATKLKQSLEVKQVLSESLPSYHMRKHFLMTLDSPYPSQADKEALMRITNKSSTGAGRPPLESHQLTLWFINARRRSGWSNILRKYARGDRSRMKALVKSKMVSSSLSAPLQAGQLPVMHSLHDNLSDNLGLPLTAADKKEFEEEWDSMISWIRYGVKEKVGEWVYDLVAASKKPAKPGQPRAVTTSAKRSPALKPATPAQSKSKQRKAKQRASTSLSIDSTIGSSGLESTPELSMCSTADTSLSSFASNLSMTRYDPFPHHGDLLQSPTLHAKRNRRVRALPKRATLQKPNSNGKCKFCFSSRPCPLFPLTFPLLLFPDPDEKAIGTCLPVPTDFKLPCTHEQVEDSEDASHISTQAQLHPPYDALGHAPMPLSGMRRESVSFNSLSAAFG